MVICIEYKIGQLQSKEVILYKAWWLWRLPANCIVVIHNHTLWWFALRHCNLFENVEAWFIYTCWTLFINGEHWKG